MYEMKSLSLDWHDNNWIPLITDNFAQNAFELKSELLKLIIKENLLDWKEMIFHFLSRCTFPYLAFLTINTQTPVEYLYFIFCMKYELKRHN